MRLYQNYKYFLFLFMTINYLRTNLIFHSLCSRVHYESPFLFSTPKLYYKFIKFTEQETLNTIFPDTTL